MSSIETRLGAQPHILSVQGRAPRLLPCVSVREKRTEKRRKGDRESEVERLKSKWTWIGGDQWRCWTVERICVTAISKTITPAAPTVELIPSSSAPSSDLTLSQRTPLCRGGRAQRPPGPNSGQPTPTAGWSTTSLKHHEFPPAHRQQQIYFFTVCGTFRTTVGIVFSGLRLWEERFLFKQVE